MRQRGMCSWPSSRFLYCAVTLCRGSCLTAKYRRNFRQICFSSLDFLSLSVQLNRFVEIKYISQRNNRHVLQKDHFTKLRELEFQIVQLAKSSSFLVQLQGIIIGDTKYRRFWRENHSVDYWFFSYTRTRISYIFYFETSYDGSYSEDRCCGAVVESVKKIDAWYVCDSIK